MKSRTAIRLAIAMLIACSVTMFSCKKDNTASSDTTSITDQGDDQAQVSTEVDNVANDASTSLEGQSAFSGDNVSAALSVNSVAANNVSASGTLQLHGLICDASVTYDTSNDQRVITIVYDGTNCWGNRTRTGTVVITLPLGQHWKDAGATATISVQNLKITRIRDGKSIVINGSKVISNVSGGLLKNLATLGTITHTITSDGITITFDNGSSRTWHIAKQRVFTYSNGIVITTTGTYSDGTDSGIAEWGTNRAGNSFTSLISQPRVIRQDCDFRLVSGENTVKLAKGTIVVTYGLDAQGNPTSCPGTGTYYYKLVWTGTNGNSYTVIRPY